MSGSSPGWATNYVPPATEWNQWFANKADYTALATLIALTPSSPSYANDAAAAAGGVAVGAYYRNGNFVMMRLT